MTNKILVVDDERDIARVLSKALGSHGYEVDSVGDSTEALKMIEKRKFDLVILDILMPVMDGAQLAQVLKQNPATRDIPIIFMTALQTKQPEGGYAMVGDHPVFAKPYDIEELLRKINEMLKAQKP